MMILQTPTIPITDIPSILAWIIGVLILFIGALFIYFKSEVKEVRTELKTERAYMKLQDGKNIEMLVNVNNVLNDVSIAMDKTSNNVSEIFNVANSIQPLIEKNTERLLGIKSHLDNGKH